MGPAFLAITKRLCLSHAAQSVIQSAFAASGFVFMNNAFVYSGVDNGHRGFERCLRLLFVAGSYRRDYFFNKSAQVAALSGIANTAVLCLTRSLFSLG